MGFVKVIFNYVPDGKDVIYDTETREKKSHYHDVSTVRKVYCV